MQMHVNTGELFSVVEIRVSDAGGAMFNTNKTFRTVRSKASWGLGDVEPLINNFFGVFRDIDSINIQFHTNQSLRDSISCVHLPLSC